MTTIAAHATLERFAESEIDLDRERDMQSRKRTFIGKVFDSVEEVMDRLAPAEYDFFESMQKRWEDYELLMYCSEAQWMWLWRIACKYRPELFGKND